MPAQKIDIEPSKEKCIDSPSLIVFFFRVFKEYVPTSLILLIFSFNLCYNKGNSKKGQEFEREEKKK
jgi:hypothetical protein